MAVTQADIDALKKAIYSGATKVSYRDRSVDYRSLSEMKQTLADMQREISGGKREPYKFKRYDRGYNS
ncbi:phage head-tail joining protein [Agarilytica rhodophyticola]|uniref:phage head-tail joining protein n=1 Tax=Agarilytica rhodophyticola TaxID=1737490 RepID=UPI000B34576E|nr:hypothetical protein [Agarilytica rhodophyticola]